MIFLSTAWTMFTSSYPVRVGVYIALAVLAVTFAAWYIRATIIENYEAKQALDMREKVHDALRAGDNAVRDPKRLRDNDGWRRD